MIQKSFDLAVQHHQAGRFAEAENLYRQILAQQPQHVDALHNLGLLAHQVGRNDIAVELIGQVLLLNPNLVEAHNNLGMALSDLRRFDEAIAAFQTTISLDPKIAGVHSNLGNALKEKGQLDEAIAVFRQAIALQPNSADAHNNLGNALRSSGDLDAAIAAYRQAIKLNPKLMRAHSNLVYALHFHPNVDAAAIAEEHRRWDQAHAQPLRQFIQPHANDPAPNRRLKIGYVSADFYNHASAHFLLPLFQNHDAAQVELFCYAQVPRPDAITQRFHEIVSQWRPIVGLSDERVAQQIRADRIDILVDLKLHTAGHRLLVFARKPAPVQATWLGYPGSSGLTLVDYRLSDPYLDPAGIDEFVYSEKTLRLPDTFWCYDPLDGRQTPVNALPAVAKGTITFGSLNNFNKMNNGTLFLWAQVLQKVENAQLLLLAPEGSPRKWVLDRLSHEGIDPQRIEFIPRQSREGYLLSYHRIDICLDTFPVNGHTTSLDSFWMGVPVITLVAQNTMGRAGLSQLSNLGMGDLAAHTPDQFVQIAASLANDLPRLQEMRATLRQRMQQSPLMDAPRFARNVEFAYRQMWHRWCETKNSDS